MPPRETTGSDTIDILCSIFGPVVGHGYHPPKCIHTRAYLALILTSFYGMDGAIHN